MTNAYLAPLLKTSFLNNNGQPLVGGLLYSYAAGTTTPIATYTDNTGATANSNPITLDYRGSCNVWLTPNVAYKFTLTDSFGNLIFTEDQVINAQLTNLYGGVDTGIVNAYVLNFVSPFSSLVNGIIVYWIPSNTNTGPSTLNVNNLGAVNILNQNGNTLTSGQIVAGGVTAVIYYNGSWLLTSATGSIPQSGSFTGTLTGMSTGVACVCSYSISGYVANINLGYAAGTSTATTMTLTGAPAILIPSSNKLVGIPVMTNNSGSIASCYAALGPSGGGVISFGNFVSGFASLTGWTASNVKGVGYSLGAPYGGVGVTMAYNLV